MKRINELEVMCPEGVVFKKVDFNQDDLDKVVKLKCASKANAVVLLDGNPQTEASLEIDWKKIKKYANKIEIYAISKAQFKILFGFGGYAFEERKTSIKTNLGFTGQCTLEVVSFKEILNSFPGAEELTEEAATSAFRISVCDVIKSAIGDELSRLRLNEVEPTLIEIKEKQSKDGMFNKLRDFFAAKGLALKDFNIKVNFPSDFLDKYQEFADRDADNKQMAKELEALKNIK